MQVGARSSVLLRLRCSASRASRSGVLYSPKRFNDMLPPKRAIFPIDAYSGPEKIQEGVEPTEYQKLLAGKNISLLKDNPEGDPLFTAEVGTLPFPYNEEEPLKEVNNALNNNSMSSNTARVYLRFLRKRNPAQAIQVLRHLSENFVELNSDFYSRFIRGLSKPETAVFAYEAYKILKETRERESTIVEYSKQLNGPKAWKMIQDAAQAEGSRLTLKLDHRVQYRLFKALIDPQSGLWEEAVRVYHDSLPATRTKFTLTDYHLIIEWHLQQDDLNTALAVHHQMHLHSIQMNSKLTLSLMEACYKANRPRSALNIYDMAYPAPLTYKNQIPHTDSPAALHLALNICSEYDLIDRAAYIYNRSCVEPNIEIYSILIHILARRPDLHHTAWEIAHGIEKDMKLLSDLEKERKEFEMNERGEEEKILVDSRPSATSIWSLNIGNALINASSTKAQLREAIDSMRDENISPNQKTFNLLLKKVAELENGKEFFERREFKSMEKDNESYDLLVRFSKENQSKLSAFEEMIQNNVTPLPDTINYLIDEFMNDRMTEEDIRGFLNVSGLDVDGPVSVDRLFELFDHLKVESNNKTHSVVLSAYNKKKEYDEAVDYFDSLKKHSLDAGIGNLVLWALLESGNQERANELFTTMTESGVSNSFSNLLMENDPQGKLVDALTETTYDTTIRPLETRIKEEIGFQEIRDGPEEEEEAGADSQPEDMERWGTGDAFEEGNEKNKQVEPEDFDPEDFDDFVKSF